VGPHVDVLPGFVGEVVDEAAEDIEVVEVVPAFRRKEREGAIEGAVPDPTTSALESRGVEGKGGSPVGCGPCHEGPPERRRGFLVGAKIMGE
jgi:hypothetical protein